MWSVRKVVFRQRCHRTKSKNRQMDAFRKVESRSRRAQLVESWTRVPKFVSSIPSRSCGRIFFCWVIFLCWFLFGVQYISILPTMTLKDPGHSAKSFTGYSWACVHLWPIEVEVVLSRPCLGMGENLVREQGYLQLVREHLSSVISAYWATVDWLWRKEWNCCEGVYLQWKKKEKRHRQGMIYCTFPQILGWEEKATARQENVIQVETYRIR